MRLLSAALVTLALSSVACGGGGLPAALLDGGSSAGDGGAVCGNGIVEGKEECDDGEANGPNKGCEADCTSSCIPQDPARGDRHCAPADSCKGRGYCGHDHRCQVLDPMPSGAACGAAGHICKDGACIPAVCGDGLVTAPEECDDGKNDGSGGCGPDCRFVCVAGDPARSCAPADACQGQGSCNAASHQCTPGTALADGTPCASGGHCRGGACVPSGATCGNGIVEPGEDCDFGSANGPGSGCETNCKFSCTAAPDSCPQGDVCSGHASCAQVSVGGHTGQRCAPGTPLPDNTGCGGGNLCHSGVCSAPAPAGCGNGQPGAGKECDFGSANNGPGNGCEWNCKFSCGKSPDTCLQGGDVCRGPNSCTTFSVGVGTGTGQKCMTGTQPPACSACGTGGVCVLGRCRSSVCGDGCVDTRRGETCEPPGQGGCDAQCHSAPACGNGILDPGEQCDDGNRANLDGCDASCKLEQDQRATSIKLQMPPNHTDSYCTANAIGGAIVNSTAQGKLQGSLDNEVAIGAVTMAFKVMGLGDLTGAGNQTVQLGAVSGSPSAAPSGTSYDGANDLDWWYVTDTGNLDSNRAPTALLAGTLAGKALDSHAAHLSLKLALGGGPATMSLSTVKLRANLGNSSAPKKAAGNATPGHTAAEHLDPSITSFESMSNGELCGNVSAASLAAIPLPAAIQSAGCVEGYTTSNTLLDVLAGGCSVAFGLVSAITANPNPDQVDPAMPAVGAGGNYHLTMSGTSVTGCKDKNRAPVDLNKCLAAAAYSVFFTFTTDRVILK